MNTLSGGPLVAGLGSAPPAQAPAAPCSSSSSDGGSVSNSPTAAGLLSSAAGAASANGNGSADGPNAPGAGGIKKRRKSDSKPLSQINKCLNEKRRREQVSVTQPPPTPSYNPPNVPGLAWARSNAPIRAGRQSLPSRRRNKAYRFSPASRASRRRATTSRDSLQLLMRHSNPF